MAKAERGTGASHPDGLEPVSGLRAVACLGVLIGHCMFWVVGSSYDKLQVYAQLDRHPWMTGLMKMPELFMDTFLVLTGFLAAQTLVRSMTVVPAYGSCIYRLAISSPPPSLASVPCGPHMYMIRGSRASCSTMPVVTSLPFECRYYTKRFMRIAPSLYSMLTLVYMAVLPAIKSDRISPDARLCTSAWMLILTSSFPGVLPSRKTTLIGCYRRAPL